MRFGAFFICEYYPQVHHSQRELYEAILTQTEFAEQCGFDSAWVAEHHFHPQYGICPSPPVMLSAMAQRTRRLRLGVAVSLLPFRSPIETAEQYAMVDVLSNGRLVFGIGRGYIKHEYAGLNLPYEESRDRFLEALEIVGKAWQGETFSHEGKYHQYQDVALNLLPVQRPGPPTYLAALSPESFDLAARLGYGFMVVAHTLPLDELRRAVAHGRQAWSQAGRSLSELECVAAYHTYLNDSSDRARVRGEEMLSTYYELVRSFEPSSKHEYMAQIRAGYGTAKVEEVRRNRSLIGSPDEIIERIEFLSKEFGITQFLCICNTGAMTNEETIETLRLMGERVIPHFAGKAANRAAASSR
ncbi:MAG: LLM class flavin-dependent oxidoreductase [Candidatus Binataceae bacterium]|nr:LLM class flavin-dependent oxidoreductase [Candidatus Binataceae bacterium]